MEEVKNGSRVYFGLLLGVIGVSFSAILIRNTTAPPSVIATYRMGFTFLFFFPLIIQRGRKELLAIGKKEGIYCLLSGVCLALHFITWMSSLQYTTVAASTVLVSLQPIFTVTAAYLLYGERVGKKGMIGIVIAMLGSGIIGIMDFHLGEGSAYGDLLALAGALFGALYITLGRGVRKGVSLLTYGFVVYGICTLILWMITLAWKIPLTGYEGRDYALFFVMAILCTLGGHTIFNWALKYIEANKVSTAMLGEPVGATLLAVLILGEVPSPWQILSGILILFGIYMLMKASIKEEKGKEEEGNTEIQQSTRAEKLASE